MANQETVPEPQQTSEDNPALSPEVLDKIKHPPAIDDVMRDLPPEELMGNQAIVPQTLDEPSDLRSDLQPDEPE